MSRFQTLASRRNWPYVVAVIAFGVAARLGLGSQALSQVGLSAGWSSLVLLAMLACRDLTVPAHVMRGGRQRLHRLPAGVQRVLLRMRAPFAEETAVLVSVGGVLIPLGVLVYMTAQDGSSALAVFNASILVIGVVELVRLALLRAHVLRRFASIAPVVALLMGWTLGADHRAALVCVSGFVAVLATADLPVLSDLQTIGTREVVIGGDASFGAIFLNYVLSMLFT